MFVCLSVAEYDAIESLIKQLLYINHTRARTTSVNECVRKVVQVASLATRRGRAAYIVLDRTPAASNRHRRSDATTTLRIEKCANASTSPKTRCAANDRQPNKPVLIDSGARAGASALSNAQCERKSARTVNNTQSRRSILYNENTYQFHTYTCEA